MCTVEVFRNRKDDECPGTRICSGVLQSSVRVIGSEYVHLINRAYDCVGSIPDAKQVDFSGANVMEYRLETLHSFLPVFFSIQKHKNLFEDDPELLEDLENSRSKFHLYGKKDEIETFEAMIKAIEARDIPTLKSKFEELIELLRIRIRSELGSTHNKANALGREKSAARSSLCCLPPVICDVSSQKSKLAI